MNQGVELSSAPAEVLMTVVSELRAKMQASLEAQEEAVAVNAKNFNRPAYALSEFAGALLLMLPILKDGQASGIFGRQWRHLCLGLDVASVLLSKQQAKTCVLLRAV